MLRLFASGVTPKEIGGVLGIAYKTVGAHTVNIRRKMGFSTMLLSALASVRAGLISMDLLPVCDLKVLIPEE